MSSELLALETYLTNLYRDASSVTRLAEQTGLSAARLPIGTPTRANLWHEFIAQAIAENKLGALIDIIEGERPIGTGNTVRDLYSAYKEAASEEPPKARTPHKPQQQNNPQDMSDLNRHENRIDTLQKEVADTRILVAELRTTLSFIALQSTKLQEKMETVIKVLDEQNRVANERDGHSDDLPHDIKWYVAIAVAIIITILVLSYFGGNI